VARAQESPWSAEVSIGWDNAISGDFLTGAIGTFQGAPVVLDKQKWDDVYGTGLLLNIAAGYTLNERSELRAGFTYQSAGSDDTLTVGTFRGGPLAARFGDYGAWGLDGGYRYYFAERVEKWRPYAGAALGFGKVNSIDADLAQTGVGVRLDDVEFYEGNAALTLGLNGGVLYRLTDRLSLDGRIGLRYISGLSDVNEQLFTGLDEVNSGTSRWSLPITVGVRVGF
jgi:hypothetical protein